MSRLLFAALAAALLAPSASAQTPVVFDAKSRTRLVLTAPGYRLVLSKSNGAILDLRDRRTDARVTLGSENACLWTATFRGPDPDSVGGCSYSAAGPNTFSYRWDRSSSTLRLTYDADDAAARRVDASVELVAGPRSFDLRLTLEQHWGGVLTRVVLPAELRLSTKTIEAGYQPTWLPGIKLAPAFFSRPGSSIQTYPGRWAWADYLALDVAGGHLAVYSVNPMPNPIAPVRIGFEHRPDGNVCAGNAACLVHAFQTWTEDGGTWTSPPVRVLVGAPVEESLRAFATDNGIDDYPSLEDKVGKRLETLVRAPLVKADPWKALPRFADWGDALRRLPSPVLLHPVAFQARGHDENYPDLLPTDPRFGSIEEFRAAIREAQALGMLVMPYTNITWWDDESPTLRALPRPLTLSDVAAIGQDGYPYFERYDIRDGYRMSPWSPFVKTRVGEFMEQWRSEVPVDCVFFDQLGARAWARDFNPSAPSPLAYSDGWVELMTPYRDRCLMVEDGWDRLAYMHSAFHSSLLLGERIADDPERHWGAGNWQPFPLAQWLFAGKVLFYQHDLAEITLTEDPETLMWNMAFGLLLTYSWDELRGTLDSPWLDVVADFQRALGPHYAARTLTSYRREGDVSESVFGDDYRVVANWNAENGHSAGGYDLTPFGWLARTDDGTVLAGTFSGEFGGVPLSPGDHYLLVERTTDVVTVRQPLGADTTIAVEPPASWRGGALAATAYGRDGSALGRLPVEARDGRVLVEWRRMLAGGRVVSVRITAG